MSADDAPVTVLSEDECWSLLSSMSLGRIVTILGGKPEIFPVNFVTQRRTVLFRTAQGTKLYSAVMGGWVAFEADYHDPPLTYGWSVIIKGRAHVLSANADILDAEEAPLRQADHGSFRRTPSSLDFSRICRWWCVLMRESACPARHSGIC